MHFTLSVNIMTKLNPNESFITDTLVLSWSFSLHIPIPSGYQSRPGGGLKQWTHGQ